MTYAQLPPWDWRSEGFKSPPVRIATRRVVTLYRVWGGTSSELGSPKRPGVCLSFVAPTSRRQAEGLFSVWEWGNTCQYVSAFEMQVGAVLFIGKADPGDWYDAGLGAPGSQVFVEQSEMRRSARKIGAEKTLVNDMGRHVVIPNKEPSRGRWS